MKITEKQINMLIRILEGSCSIEDGGKVFLLTKQQRLDLFNQLMNQQSNELIDISDE